MGVRADLAPSWGICSRIKAKGGDTGCGVLIEASPPQVPSRRAWPAVSSLQQLRQGGDSGKDAHRTMRYPVFQTGKGARRVCEGRRGAGSAQQLATPQDGGVEGLRGDPGESPDQPGFGRWLLGRYRAEEPTSPKFQLVLILSETPQSGAIAAIPPGLPQPLPK